MLDKNRINEFLKTIDDGSLCLDDNNTCEVMVKDEFSIILKFDPATATFIMVSVVGSMPDNLKAQLIMLKQLMAENFLWDATLGATLAMMDDEFVVLQKSYNENSDGTLDAALLDFAEKCQYMKLHLDSKKFEIVQDVKEEEELDETGMVVEIDDDDEKSPDLTEELKKNIQMLDA